MGGSPANKRNYRQKSNGQQAKPHEKGGAEPPQKPVAKAEQVQYQAATKHKATSSQHPHPPPAMGSQAAAQALGQGSSSGAGHKRANLPPRTQVGGGPPLRHTTQALILRYGKQLGAFTAARLYLAACFCHRPLPHAAAFYLLSSYD